MEVGTVKQGFMSETFQKLAAQGSSNLLNKLGGNEMSKKIVKGLGIDEAINKLNLGEGEIKMEQAANTNTQTNTEAKATPQAENIEEAKIMEEINEAVNSASEDVQLEDVLTSSVKGIMLLNDDILTKTNVEITNQSLLNKTILAILTRIKAGYTFAGLLNEEKEDAIKAFLQSLATGVTELSILPAGGILFKKGEEVLLETACPKIIPVVPEGVQAFGKLTSKGTIFNISEDIIDAIIDSFKKR